MAPQTSYHFIRTYTDDIVIAVADDGDKWIAIDHYELTDKSLNYKGSYPLIKNGTANIGRTIILSQAGKISIDYSGDSTNTMVTYSM